MMRIGMLTPSSNTMLEPVTYKILQEVEDLTVHFSRIGVTQIALSKDSNSQFEFEKMKAAAQLLADAKVDLLVWNGTSASWLGLENDRQICSKIESELGIPMVTSSIAILEAFKALNVDKIGLVTPYTADVSGAIIKQYESFGLDVLSEQYAGLTVNHDFALVNEEKTNEMIQLCKSSPVEGIAVVCTNLNAASIVKEAEQPGIAVIDSISATLWYSMKQLGLDTKPLADQWGTLFNY